MKMMLGKMRGIKKTHNNVFLRSVDELCVSLEMEKQKQEKILNKYCIKYDDQQFIKLENDYIQ